MKKFQLINSLLYSCIVAVVLLMTSCGSTKKISSNRLSKKTAANIIELHNAANLDFSTYASKLRLNYDDGKKQVSPSATLRLEKDKQLWLSVKFLGFTVAKAYITPKEVQFYEKLGKRYYKGDFTAISSFLGTTVTFKSLQDLLLGQSMLALEQNQLEIVKDDRGNLNISPKKPSKKYKYSLTLDQLHYKVASYFISQSEKNRQLDMNYTSYQEIEGKQLPEKMTIEVKGGSNDKKLHLEFNRVDLDNKLSFPFNIPSGYQPFHF